jgi:hypothetical protein
MVPDCVRWGAPAVPPVSCHLAASVTGAGMMVCLFVFALFLEQFFFQFFN